ncbi:hypothetical protein B9Z55_027964 [Caenorhabditis nigoni]|uniref:Protein kinase domain-containing protein n=1 Tax=Caenorhabditis nigoni TaxID=1611254 RepID=A0A2G5SDF2_9PELO|nr:hypothetical protein B9Z55_027964 [Caenorhabditis nigoni]
MNVPRLELEVNQSIGPYEIVNDKFGIGGFGQIFEVRDTRNRRSNGRLLLKTQSFKYSHFKEWQILNIMKNEKGFTDLLNNFIIEQDNIDHFCMVIPYQGETFARVLQRSTASPNNAVRIAYQLFTLLEKLHAIGFVHRDVHYKNLLIDMSVDGILEITLIDFGVCEPMNPPPVKSRMCSRHQSIHMCRSARYSVFDDLHSLVFLIMQCVGITPFLTDNKQRFDKKTAFHANPYRYFPIKDTTWIADLYTLIENQRESGYHYNSLLDLLDEAIPGVDPSEPIEYRWRNNTFLLA